MSKRKQSEEEMKEQEDIELRACLSEMTKVAVDLQKSLSSLTDRLTQVEADINSISAVEKNRYLDGQYTPRVTYYHRDGRNLADLSYYYLNPQTDRVEPKTFDLIPCNRNGKIKIVSESHENIVVKNGLRSRISINKATNQTDDDNESKD